MRALIFFILVSIPVAAINRQNSVFERKLQELTELVKVEFSPALPFFERYDGVMNLYTLVFQKPQSAGYFGPDKIIRRVIIEKSYLSSPEALQESALDLYVDAILFPFDGRFIDQLIGNLSRFASEIAEISVIEDDFKTIFPALIFSRTEDLLYQISGSNRIYLNTLRTLFDVTDYFTDAMQAYDVIKINHVEAPSAVRVRTGTTWSGEKVLVVDFGFDLSERPHQYITTSLLAQYLDIIVLKGFDAVKYDTIRDHFIGSVISELWLFLTDDMVERLRSNGVKSLKLSDKSEELPSLFCRGELTLGLTREEMQRVVDHVF